MIRYIYSVGFENYLRENVLFTSLEQYKKGLITFDAMRFENYEMIFELYIVICLSTLAVFGFVKIRKRLYQLHFKYGYRIGRLRKRFRKMLTVKLKKLWQAGKSSLKRKTVESKSLKPSAERIKVNFLQQNLFGSITNFDSKR